ncbi:protein transport protein Sec24A-like [Tigriopus californicus]|uniref:protein transport protein Sec24A-like n=1 Tax=Tigriopus californicus TaxID=6832 RepID=UPI0027D9DFC4|nr:protein transport protein Sec24A-like [Tigriopus californicus]
MGLASPAPSMNGHPGANYGGSQAGLANGRSGTYFGMEPLDLLQNRHILPAKPVTPPKPQLTSELWRNMNCSPDIFRCTLTKIPETEAILKKSRLPLGVLIHPFKDLSHLPVIQCSTIVRCRQCRTYINPFVQFVDQRRWRCNVCYRVNELPEEFMYDPVSKSYGDPSRRPECKAATIEFIAPSEYMLRPPQPAVYIFLLDVSHGALETGYLKTVCDVLLEELDKLPGDGRTQLAFLTYDRSVHFYSMPDGASQPTQLSVSDIDDMFLPSPSDLLVNREECHVLIEQLLAELPNMFKDSYHTDSALGAALQAAYKLAAPTGGRITVFQTGLPNVGPGALPPREVLGDKKSESSLMGPATDFYKKLSLDCSGQQIAVDLFTLNSQYLDLATLSGISKFSGGQTQHFSGYHASLNTPQAARFESALRRYLSRKIGFEAVMRIRCTRGLTPHAFHGNFFVRSTDLLSLPNINPDAGFAMQVAIEDDLRDSREVCFQAALLYTSSKGERRIRVHTICLPTTTNVSEVINGADQEAIVGMLAKFGADRALSGSIPDAKEGMVVANLDAFETYKTYSSMGHPTGLLMAQSLRLLPLYTLACMRSVAFRSGQKADDRSDCIARFKSLPLTQLLQFIYPDLYRVDELTDEGALEDGEDEEEILIPQPPRLQLSFERISATGLYLLDACDIIMVYISRGLHQFALERIFGVQRIQNVDETLTELPELETPESERLRHFVNWLNSNKAYPAPIRVIREDGKLRHYFVERMIEDRQDNSFSYFEFLQHLKQQIK